ncbi:ankyrin repeat domain-containing protein [Elusimicrobiota bacterium]
MHKIKTFTHILLITLIAMPLMVNRIESQATDSPDEMLRAAVRTDDAGQADLALRSGADPNAMWDKNFTVLGIVSAFGPTEIAKLLIDSGADVHKRDRTGETAITWASKYGNTKAVKLLFDAGADVNTAGVQGITPLMRASFMGHLDTVVFLIWLGADVNGKDMYGYPVMTHACTEVSIGDHMEIIRVLKLAGARGECPSYDAYDQDERAAADSSELPPND